MIARDASQEYLDLEERAQQQLERLQSTLNRAYKNVPFYQNRLREAGVEPSRIESVSDLARVPFTEREHLGENYPYGLFAVPLRDVVRIHTARGTALNPTVSGYTRQDIALWRELTARALATAGVSRSDILQIDLDPGLANWGRDYKDGAEAIEASVVPLTLLPPEKQLMVLRDYKTSVLVTSASAADRLIDHLFRANINPISLALKTLVLVGEPPDPEVRDRLERQLHAKTWVHYGLTDVPGPGLAFECEEHRGLHVSEDHFLSEVVDVRTGEAVLEGGEGELILTTLTTRAFPLVRFRTGDRVRMMAGECPCGRTLRRFEWFPRPGDEVMVIRGVKVYRQQVLLLLERALGFAPGSWKCMAGKQELKDCLEVWLEVDDRLFSDEIKEMEKLSRDLCMDLEQELGVPVRIRFRESRSFEVFSNTPA